MWLLLRGPAHIVGPIQLTPQAYRADLFGLIVPARAQLIAPHALQHIFRNFANGENGSYLGLPLLVALAAGVYWMRRRGAVVVAAATAAVVFVLSLGGALASGGAPASNVAGNAVGRVPLPEALLAKLPLLHNLIPARFAMYVALLAGIVLACIVDQLHTTLSSSGSRYAAGGARRGGPRRARPAPAVGVADHGGPSRRARVFYSSNALKAVPANSVALVYPFPSGTYPAGTLWQAVANFRSRFPAATSGCPSLRPTTSRSRRCSATPKTRRPQRCSRRWPTKARRRRRRRCGGRYWRSSGVGT